jgi:fructose-specific phosphotransferase system IIA component
VSNENECFFLVDINLEFPILALVSWRDEMKLIDVLKPENIKTSLHSLDKESVIKELIDLIYPNQFLEDKDSIFDAVIEREKIMTTGVGREVAIPHCKRKNCTDFIIALGIHPSGIDFNSIDNRPVKIIFLLIGPEDNPGMHIRLLSRISRLIAKEKLRENLLLAVNANEVYNQIKEEEEKYFENSP